MKKFVFVLCFLLFTASILFAGGTSESKPAADAGTSKDVVTYVGMADGSSRQQASKKDTVKFRINADLASLDPHMIAGQGNEAIVLSNVYEGLFRADSDAEGNTRINLGLAESFEYADAEQKELVVHLRKGIKFHNGDELKADDVVFSLNRSIEAGYNEAIMSVIKGVEKVDDYTVKISLPYAYGAIQSVLACDSCYIVNKKTFEGKAKEETARIECGTGPYTVAKWEAGSKIFIEAFEDYWRGPAAIKHGEYIIIQDNNASMIAFENKEFDVTNHTATIDELVIRKDTKHYGYSLCTTTGCGRSVVFNVSPESPFNDIRLRQAVAMSIDKKAIIEAAYDGVGVEGGLAIPPIYEECPSDVQPFAYDLEKAKQLVKEAGLEGTTVKVTIADQDQYKKPMIILQQNLKEIGINLEIDAMARAAWNEKVLKKGDFEMTYYPLLAKYADVDSLLYPLHSSNKSGMFTTLNDPYIDEMLEKGRSLGKGEERNKVYGELCKYLTEQAYFIPVQNITRFVPYRIGLKGVTASPQQKLPMYNYYWE